MPLSPLEREIADLVNSYIDNEETAEDIAHDVMRLIRSKDIDQIIE